MRPEDYAVDNASLATADDQHPCGGWDNGLHDWNGGRCRDCGWTCRHEDEADAGRCLTCGEIIDVEESS